MSLNARLPKLLWPEAVNYACLTTKQSLLAAFDFKVSEEVENH
jgi:hypothetical protein